MPSASSQFRAVAISYTLLGALFLAIAVMLVTFTWPAWSGPFLWQQLGSATAKSIASYISIALGLWVLAWLALRYSSLNAAWRTITLAASVIPAIWSILGAVKVTLTGTEALGWMPAAAVIGLAWLFAIAYSVPSYLLWKHRRASGNHWRGP